MSAATRRTVALQLKFYVKRLLLGFLNCIFSRFISLSQEKQVQGYDYDCTQIHAQQKLYNHNHSLNFQYTLSQAFAIIENMKVIKFSKPITIFRKIIVFLSLSRSQTEYLYMNTHTQFDLSFDFVWLFLPESLNRLRTC